ncbi:outer membrane beta-barrel protein [Flavobacterium sp. XGLA_31]|uniref:outer membrane beta-barrel protein n=1 Tax=Flavobacterium sp. XGLA_31 TaxID=3447666 RepID=UPI003F3BECCD
MKKIILTVAAVFALSFANAQDKKESSFGFGKGDIYVGGRISYSSEDDDVVKTTSTTIAPEAGYFISDNFALTLGLESTSVDNGTNKPSQFNVNVGGRYYFLNLGERFKTFTNFGIGFGTYNPDITGADNTKTFGFKGGVGINYFVTPKLAIDFGLADVLSYQSAKTGDAKQTNTDLNVNVFNNFFNAASFGLIYKF